MGWVPWLSFPQLRSDPAQRFVAIVPSDTVSLLQPVKRIYVGGAGDVTIIGVADTVPVTFKAVPQGTTLDVGAGFVKATGTTATLLIGHY